MRQLLKWTAGLSVVFILSVITISSLLSQMDRPNSPKRDAINPALEIAEANKGIKTNDVELIPNQAGVKSNQDTPRLWVNTDILNRRTCPNRSCGIVGFLLFRESALDFERKGDWVRVTEYYDASCRNGVSDYVDAGNNSCTAANGIVRGQFAEWVNTKYLTAEQPADPSGGATGLAAIVGQSDDFRKYQDQFVQGAKTMISNGWCTQADLKNTGGFIRSVNRGNGFYFTYCGDNKKYYLNVRTGDVSRG